MNPIGSEGMSAMPLAYAACLGIVIFIGGRLAVFFGGCVMNLKDACWLRYVNGGHALWRHAFEACDAAERWLRRDA
jgi:uncharacterized membrane protein YczE